MADFWNHPSAMSFRPPGNFKDTYRLTANHAKVLDLGCNRAWLAGLIENYYGLDLNEPAIREARAFWAEAKKWSPEEAEVRLRIGTSATLPFEKDSFDFIFCKDVLEHVHEPVAFLSECARVLKPRGHLLLITPDAQSWVWNDPTHVRP
jgi:2-polyprenyl-3-methyl-5-hydroxy-6-metoxy-1,4-benzoquinol methylase